MKLKEYIKILTKLSKKYPNVEVIYSCDEEGNAFSPVHCNPCLGNYGGGEFVSDDGTEEFKTDFKINSICIN